MPDSTEQESFSGRRILFLRSTSHVTFAAFIAGGLSHGQFQYMQYPPLPEERTEKLEKLYNPAQARDYLERNLIHSRKQLLEKLDHGFFDLVLILDYDGSLFRYIRMKRLQKIRNLLGQVKNLFANNWSGTSRFRELRYIRGVPLTPEELATRVPIAVVDLDDWICLPPSVFELLRHCSLYFKREVPFNRFFLYYQSRPAPWCSWRKKLAPLCEKVQNIPLGIEDAKYFSLKSMRSKRKDIDIFYCGQPTSTPRLLALKYLQQLRETTGWKIVIEESLPFDEYCDRISRSMITLSVSGGGWDCFRHYEAVALGSIPFMDAPTVDSTWWRKLPENVFFDNTFINFKSKLGHFLSSPVLRETCFALVEESVEKYMLHSRIVDYILNVSLSKNNSS
ncbi:hypothetical protein KKHLCK_15325 [Candidatus Electrothrix laxa]